MAIEIGDVITISGVYRHPKLRKYCGWLLPIKYRKRYLDVLKKFKVTWTNCDKHTIV